MPRPQLYLIDGRSYRYRAFHAIPRLSNSKGLPTNAVYGFTTMLLKIVNEQQPEYLAVAFDPKGPTQRHGTYEAYKANRPEMPEPLQIQVPYIHKLVASFRIPVLLEQGEEADDLIGTVAKQAAAAGFDVTIVTGDKDMLQLITDHVRVMDTMKDRIFREEEIRERFGVGPAQIPEIMGLMGDAIDNIPGVKGIGEKTAVDLIQRYGSVENLLSHAGDISKPKLRQLLTEQANEARLSRDLAVIRTDLPMNIDLSAYQRSEPDGESLISLFRELEFSSLLSAVGVTSAAHPMTCEEVKTEAALASLLDKIRSSGGTGLALWADSPLPMWGKILGMALSPGPGESYYLSSEYLEKESLRSLLRDDRVQKYCYDLKNHLVLFRRQGVDPHGLEEDPMIASYLLNPNRSDHRIEGVALEYLHMGLLEEDRKPSRQGKEKGPDTGVERVCRRADVASRLVPLLRERLKEHQLDRLYREIEIPLASVLARMEMDGIRLDVEGLIRLSGEMEREMEMIRGRIYRLAGEEFNINSPKQLQVILFERLGLKPTKKTKTGYSTDESVLIQLALSHELPAEILNYRQFSKLKSTYVDALVPLVHPETGRLHTSFNQTVAATGRLSSSDPNLQNIPIRTEMGQRIRESFVADAGCVLLSADYSQVELRLLAHLSGDEALIASFQRNEDIHARTASEIFGLPSDQITPEMRRRAKAVNFGIVYGMSPFGLASDIGIPQHEAKAYIEHYFASHPGVRTFIDRTLRDAREKGYVTTLFGRRRPVPELISPDNNVSQFGERIAVNTPIQGTAADLIKLAMIRIAERLDKGGLRTRMILQVHDELLFEVPDGEITEIQDLARELMEGVVSLAVPLKIEMGMGRNWREAG
ncbi:MAG: DNA polymerase I [Nitrospirae bacterium]|nr:DNA polymerase I [Nitrospirota bacterium]